MDPLYGQYVQYALLLAGAFVLGSVPFGMIFTRSSGVDIAKVGSGNIGATNVLRAVGAKQAVLTLACDLLKGTAAVAAGSWLGLSYQMVGGMGLASIMGHDFSVFRKFRGGKGVATSVGVILLYTPAAGLVTVAVWLLAVFATRVSALGALAGFAALPVAVWGFGYEWEKLFLSVIITVLLFVRHIPNIRQMLAKKENSGETG